ncbi:GNAT family N-acetyltransferase [Paenibacillus nicotianae]|uniref:GNAT family N-acetyltransferase n=1 Tax=Paenibacillus nicotianae TaxID=1526551 RepID=A0ABW4UYL3_9BACL
MSEIEVNFREVIYEDIWLLYNWSNDPLSRQMSFSSEPILKEEHEKWFAHVMENPNIVLLIAEVNNEPIGFVRFNISNDEAVISIAINRSQRGKGLAVLMINESIKYIKKIKYIEHIYAYIKEENAPSIRTFLKANFLLVEKEKKEDYFYLKFRYS